MKKWLVSIGIWLSTMAMAQLQRVVVTQPKMGSPFTIVLWHADTSVAKSIIKDAFQLVDSLNMVFSDYDPQAEVYAISHAEAGVVINCSQAMMDLLLLSRKATQKSYGSFDETMGALTSAWRDWRSNKIFPAEEAVALLKASTGNHLLQIDSMQSQITKLDAKMALDFGGIAKGYIAGQVMLFCKKNDASIVLVDAGGDIVCGAAPPGQKGWRIGVNMPQSDELYPQLIQLENKAVATSGDMYQGFEHNGKWYSHIIDPRTGYGSTHRRNVTVIAADGATADWLATAISILPVKRIKALAKKMNAEWLIATRKEEKIITRRSRNFPDLQKEE